MSYKNNFKTIETHWQNYWHKNQTHNASINHKKPKYYVLDMFPYPSGKGLHVGHVLGYVASDIIARFYKISGYEVLHPMGFDAFGLPTEQFAIATGEHPIKITQKNTSTYLTQLKKMGLFLDTNRIIKTSDPDYYKWTQWVFIQLYEHYFDKKLKKAQHISKLIDHFAKNGTKDILAYTSQSHEDFTNLQWQEFNKQKKHQILECYRLAFKEDALVNWCEELGCVLANDEINNNRSIRGNHPVSQKMLKQWKLRISAYAQRLLQGLDKLHWNDSIKTIQKNWIGKSKGVEIDFIINHQTQNKNQILDKNNKYCTLKIFTTRADTIYGVTFMVISAYHPLIKLITDKNILQKITDLRNNLSTNNKQDPNDQEMIGINSGFYCTHPLNKKPLAIWVGNYVSNDYGTGAIMAVPSDDQRDHRFAKKYNLEIIDDHQKNTILDTNETINAKVDLVIKLLNHCQKDQQIICQSKITYRIKDAIFARQRYWGEPIPIYYKDHLSYPLDPKKLPLLLPKVVNYKPTGADKAPLASLDNWKTAEGYKLETSTMPGYAGSSAYYLRYMDPKNNEALVSKQALDYWQRVDLYIGGSEHATGHLIYSRFWNMFLYDLKLVNHSEPFLKMINQGMILGQSKYIYRINDKSPITFVSYKISKNYSTQKIPVDINLVKHDILDIDKFKNWRSEFKNAEFIYDEDGHFYLETVIEKMSKSLYNTVTPDEIIDQYGADTLRLYEMFMGPIEQTKPWSSYKIKGISRFLAKFYRLFYLDSADSKDKINNSSKWIVEDKKANDDQLKILHSAIQKVTSETKNYQFNTAISAMMIATNNLLKTKAHNYEILTPMVMLIAPYCPHLAEHLYNELDKNQHPHNHKQKSVFDHGYMPKADQSYLKASTWKAPIAFNGKVKMTLSLNKNLSNKQIKDIVLDQQNVKNYLNKKTIKKWIIIPEKMINLLIDN